MRICWIMCLVSFVLGSDFVCLYLLFICFCLIFSGLSDFFPSVICSYLSLIALFSAFLLPGCCPKENLLPRQGDLYHYFNKACFFRGEFFPCRTFHPKICYQSCLYNRFNEVLPKQLHWRPTFPDRVDRAYLNDEYPHNLSPVLFERSLR